MMVLPGKFDVTPQGSASFSIPVSVPPGTGGMLPSLSLDYSSGGGDGLLGVGWSLSGLSAITRCPQTMTQDGVRGAVTYDVGLSAPPDTDRFCLDGQRLLAINNGVYGASGTQYRTEIEGFSNIVSYGQTGAGPAYFVVQTKSGQTMEFGNDSSANNTGNNSAVMLTSPNIPSIASWLIDKVTDTSGNYMIMKYAVNPDGNVANNNEVVPSEIDYTGNTNTGLLTYNRVTFLYSNGKRPDLVPRYTAGNLIETTQRLTDIETWSGTQSAQYSTAVYDYKLGYQTSAASNKSL